MGAFSGLLTCDQTVSGTKPELTHNRKNDKVKGNDFERSHTLFSKDPWWALLFLNRQKAPCIEIVRDLETGCTRYTPLSRTTETTKWLVCLPENVAQVWETKLFSWLIKFSRYKLRLPAHPGDTHTVFISPWHQAFLIQWLFVSDASANNQMTFSFLYFYLVDLFCFTFLRKCIIQT